MVRWSKPLSRTRAALGAAAVIGLCAGLGGYGVNADPPPAKAPGRVAAPEFHGTISDSDGLRIPHATVLAVADVGNGERLTTTSDAEGRFAFDKLPIGKTAFPSVQIIAVKEGFAPTTMLVQPSKVQPGALTLPSAAAFRGTVEDASGRPVGGAEVQVGFVHRSDNGTSKGSSWGFAHEAAVRGTPAERFYFVTTDSTGRFEFAALTPGSEVIFRVTAKGFAELNTGAGGPKGEHVVQDGATPAKLVLGPEAIVRGRVISTVPGLSPDAAVVKLDGTKALHGFHRSVKPAADGQFTAAGLPAGPISVVLELPADAAATAVGESVATEADKTSEVSLKIISGVEVTGRVVVRDSNEPVPGVHMATLGLVNPSSFHWPGKPTDADGRFSLRLPPGKVTVMVWSTPGNYRQTDHRRQQIEVPADAARFEIREPFELGKVVDVDSSLGSTEAPAKPAAGAGPLPVAAERKAAGLVRQLGGWYVLDGDSHVVEVNMVYHQEPGGKRFDNQLTDSDGALRAARDFPRLKRLLLHGGQATDEGLVALVGLADLEAIYVWEGIKLTDVGISHLTGLPKLQKVHISNGLIGDGALAVFAKMPSIQELSLQRNNFSDAGLKHLAGMTQLRSLWVGMSKQPITDAGVRQLAGLTSLEQLDLQSAKLTTAGVVALKDLTQLRTLCVNGPADGDTIDDASVESLLGMKKLRSLDLGNARLTADGVGRLLALPDLRDLSLNSPAIGEEARENLKKARPGLRLSISGSAKNTPPGRPQ